MFENQNLDFKNGAFYHEKKFDSMKNKMPVWKQAVVNMITGRFVSKPDHYYHKKIVFNTWIKTKNLLKQLKKFL